MLELYRRIWAVSGKTQVLLVILALMVAGLAAVPIEYQKNIINGLSKGISKRDLFMLCAAYFGILLLSNVLRIALRYRSSLLGELIIRRIRNILYQDWVDARTDDAAERGKTITKIADEAQQVGRFAGEAIAAPLVQIGTLVSIISYMAVTQPFLGLFIFLIILPQAAIVLTLQKYINGRVERRVKILRRANGEISASGISDAEQSILDDFNEIYTRQREVFRLKLSMKFTLNLIAGAGTVGILLLGGWLFLDGKTDIGTVVASLTAFKRVNDPWRSLIEFYRMLSTVRIRFELLLSSRP